MIPRFQGRVGQIEDPEEFKGKWAFEVWLSFIGDGNEPKSLGMQGPFDTEETAHFELKLAVNKLVKTAQEAVGAEPNGDCIDLKTNKIRNIGEEN